MQFEVEFLLERQSYENYHIESDKSLGKLSITLSHDDQVHPVIDSKDVSYKDVLTGKHASVPYTNIRST